MQKLRLKVPLAAVCALFVLTGTAEAHTSAAVATCTATTINFTFFGGSGSGGGGKNTVHYKVTTNATTVADASTSFTGTSTTVTVANPLFNGDVVRVSTQWASSETRDGNSQAEKEILNYVASNCGDRPPETTTPPPVIPPATVPPSTTTPPGSGGVLPETIASGQARLRGPSGCRRQAFTARVSGRSIAAVSFFLDGKLFKKFTSPKTSYSIKVSPRRYGFGRHRIVAKVTFLAASGTNAQSLPLTFRRCAQGAVSPRFTG